MTSFEIRKWDPVDHLKTQEDMAAYLEAALEDGDPDLVAAALGDIIRAKGLDSVAKESGVTPEEAVQASVPGAKPDLSAVLRIVRALGLQLHVAPFAK